jgi:hypothetical protein
MIISLYSCRRIRRAAHEALTKRVVQRYHPIQTKEATILVSSLLTPSGSLNPDKHLQRLSASAIMSILYDHPTILSEHDHTLEKIDAYNLRVSKAETLGSYFVDIFPWMIHIPERSLLLFYFLIVIVLTHDQTRFARWKREGLRQFTEDYAMFKGFLNRVRVDLVRTCLMCSVWGQTTNTSHRSTGGIDQVSVRP